MKKDYEKIAASVLEAVGGKDNITFCTHCATRLRFNLKDQSIVDEEKIKAVDGVIGVAKAGGQYQIIIGQDVANVYADVCGLAGLTPEAQVPDDITEKKKLTLKGIGSSIVDTVSGSFVPVLPVIVAASFIKLLAMLLGPSMLNVITAESDLYTLFTFVGDAGFYFLPILMGYTASQKLGVTPVLGMFMGAIMLHPTLVAIVSGGTSFTVYGIPGCQLCQQYYPNNPYRLDHVLC